MTTPTLTQTARVLIRQPTPGWAILSPRWNARIYFSDGSEDSDDRTMGISFEIDTWRDMGKPDEVTVTVAPGNTLDA